MHMRRSSECGFLTKSTGAAYREWLRLIQPFPMSLAICLSSSSFSLGDRRYGGRYGSLDPGTVLIGNSGVFWLGKPVGSRNTSSKALIVSCHFDSTRLCRISWRSVTPASVGSEVGPVSLTYGICGMRFLLTSTRKNWLPLGL